MPSNDIPKRTDTGDARLEAVTEVLSSLPGHRPGTMFGRPGVRNAAGKFVLIQMGDDLVVKLSGDDLAEALALDGAEMFTPMPGRAMNGWVVLPAAHRDQDARWALAAAESLGA